MASSPPKPHIELHRELTQEINSLYQHVQNSSVNINDMLYHFFSQYIDLEYKFETKDFIKISKEIVQTALDYDNIPWTKKLAAIIIKDTIPFELFPDKFLGRIYISDIRNCIVFKIFKRFQIIVETEFLRDTNPPGTEEQNMLYNKYAHGRPVVVDPKDSERLEHVLTWFHLTRLIFLIKHNITNVEIEATTETINSCCGSWTTIYNNKNMKTLVWDLFLNVWEYDNT
jgi:hypothetical protein